MSGRAFRDEPGGRVRRALPLPVLGLAVGVVAVLLAVSGQYGFHRDELYFIVAGRHPALGYVDQPPLNPLLSAAAVSLLGLAPTSIRILPALVVGAVIVLTALTTRELGGSRRAQVLAAVVVAVSGFLAAGHLDHTTTYDLLAWALVLWLVTGLLRGSDQRRWLLVGVVTGVALENKDTVILLGAGLIVGLTVTRRWDVLRSPWPWAAAALALLLWLPNLAWQAGHGFPQVAMAGALAGSASDNRSHLLPELLLLAGPLLFPVSLAGLWWLLRATRALPWHSLGWAFLAIVVLVTVAGGKSYYAVGFYPLLMSAGAIVLDGFLDRGRERVRRFAFAGATVASGTIAALLVLPIVPAASLAMTPIPSIYKESAEQIGWPQLVSAVQRVANGLPPAARSSAVILTANYGEAAALQLLGSGLPPVFSGHNSYWDWGPPPDDRTTVILVGDGSSQAFFSSCTVAAHVDNGYGLDNQEQGAPIALCSGLRQPWSSMWAAMRHID